MFNKSKYTSKKFKERKKKILVRKIIIFSILFILLISGTVYLSKHPSMKIEEVVVDGEKFVTKDEIQKIIFEETQGDYWFLYSKSNSFIYPRGIIKERIFNDFPSVKKVNLDFVNNHKIKIEIKEYEPVARWCNDSEKPECFFLNEDGYVFVKEPLIYSGEFVTFRGFIEGDYLRSVYISKDKFQSLEDFIKLVRRLDIHVVEVRSEDAHVFYLTTKSGAKLVIDGEDGVEDTFDNLKTVIERDAINKAQFQNIEYIDLRFGNRVFYKLK